jgi:hypothetical protein
MIREEHERELTRLRVVKHRNENRNPDGTFMCNGDVTVPVTQVKRKCNRLEVRSQKLEVIKELKTKTIAPSDKNQSLEAVLRSQREIFSKAYPGIDLDTETAKAQAWMVSNPKNKKKNLRRFLNGWFDRAQEKVNKYPPREGKFL